MKKIIFARFTFNIDLVLTRGKTVLIILCEFFLHKYIAENLNNCYRLGERALALIFVITVVIIVIVIIPGIYVVVFIVEVATNKMCRLVNLLTDYYWLLKLNL